MNSGFDWKNPLLSKAFILGKYDDKSYIEFSAGPCFTDGSELSLHACDLIKSSILNEEQFGFESFSFGISLAKLGDNEFTDEFDDVDGSKLDDEFLFDWLIEIISNDKS